jgi:hypothetical protein
MLPAAPHASIHVVLASTYYIEPTLPHVPSLANKDLFCDLLEGPFSPTLRTTTQGGEHHAYSSHAGPRATDSNSHSWGAYESFEEVVGAAFASLEQPTVPGFAGTPEELDALLAEGLASKQLAEDAFWGSVGKETEALLGEQPPARDREGSVPAICQ